MNYDITKIRSLIEKSGKHETEFLHSVGLGAKTLARWENGTEIPRQDYAEYIADKLGVNISDLCFNDTTSTASRTTKKPAPIPPAEVTTENTDRLKKDKQLKLQREQAEQKRRHQLQTIIDSFTKDPDQLFWPKNLQLCSQIPKKCPTCKSNLLLVKTYKKHFGHDKGWCCIKCSKQYVKVDHNKKQSNKPKKQPDINTPNVSKLLQKGLALSNTTGHMPEHIVNIPSSTIMLVYLRETKFDVRQMLAIVSNEQDQNSKNGIYWVGRTFPSIVMAAIYTNSPFSYRGLRYIVENYEAYGNAQKYLDLIGRFCNPSAPQDVYVFSQKNLASYSSKNYEAVTAMIPCANRFFPVPITIYYEKATKRYFMNEESYVAARKNYGLPYLRLRIANNDRSHIAYGTLKEHSELNLLGYSVGTTNGIETKARRQLLSHIIDSGVMTKSEIINHLEWLIHTRKNMKNMANALEEWRGDLMYISNYRVAEQRKIWVSNFKSRFKITNL